MARNLAAVARAVPAAAMSNPSGAFGGPLVTSGAGGPASPLIASYAEWATGRASSALPRDFSTYLAGTFGPLMPMLPQPIDQPSPGEERPEPRRYTYPVSWNMPHGQPGDEGLKLASFSQMRVMADAYSVMRACIQLRIQEILAIEWDIVPTKDAEKAMRGDRAARKEFDERRTPVKRFFNRPDPGKYHGFESWLSAVLEEIFVVDALSIYLQPSRQRGKARGIPGSNLGALCLISGDIVRPMLDLRGGIPQPPNPAWQIYQYGVPRVDLMTTWAGDDVKDMKDALTAEYRADQMIYLPYTPRSWTPYGFSIIEQALVPITSGLQRQQWQLDYYSQGSMPGVFLSTGDPNSTPNQCRELQDALNAMAGDPAWKHKIIVIPGGSKIDPIRPTPLADQFDEIVMTQVCMAADVMPMELGISSSASRNAMGAASNIAKASENINTRKALKPLLKWLKANIFDYAIREHMRQADMQWHWEGLEEGEDEAATVDVLVNEMTHGIVSIDEARVIRGHQPWGIPMTSEPVYFTATGITPLGSIDMATGAPVGAPPTNALQAAAGVVPGAPPAFGAPPGGPGKPGEPNGKPKPKGPGPNGSGGGGAPTPAHAGAQAAVTAAGHGAQALPANPKPLPKPVLAHQDPDSPLDRVSATKMAKVVDRARQRLALPRHLPPEQIDDLFVPEVDEPATAAGRLATFDPAAALRELDLIGNRLAKGRPLNGWTNRNIPADVFTALRVDGDVVKARAAVQDATARQRRDTALAAAQQQVITGLHQLAAGIGDGSVSTPGFIDAAVALLRSSIHEGLRLGTGHALVDAGRATQRTAWATKAASDGPGWVDGLDGRFGLYAGSIPHAYELGYGLATLGAHDDPDNLVIEWHARPDACDLCDTWSTMTWTAGTLPGMPGEGGFGKHATVCRGAKNCRCRLAYRLTTPDEVAKVTRQQTNRTWPHGPTTAQLDAADQRAQDAEAIRRALAADDPNAALALVLADLADERAEAQRGWLTGLLKDILTAATRGANVLRTWLVTKAFNPAEERDEHGKWTILGAATHELTQLLGKAITTEDQERSYGESLDNDQFAHGAYIDIGDNGDLHIDLGGVEEDTYHTLMDLSPGNAEQLSADIDWALENADRKGHRPPNPTNGLMDWLDRDGIIIGYTPEGRIHIAVEGAPHTPEGEYIPLSRQAPQQQTHMLALDLSAAEARHLMERLDEYIQYETEQTQKAAKPAGRRKAWQRCAVPMRRVPASAYADPPSGITKSFNPAEPRDEHGQWTLLGALVHSLNDLSDHDTERHFGRIVHSATVGDSHRITAHDTGKVLISVPEANGAHTPVAHLDAEEARTLAADLDRMATDSLHDTTEADDPGFEDWTSSDLLDDTTRVADQQSPYAGYDLAKDVHLVVPGAGDDGSDWHSEMSTDHAWATERALETAADAADDAAEQVKEARENANWEAEQARLEAVWAQAHAADVLPESDVSAIEISGAARNFDLALMSDGSIGLSDNTEFDARMTRDRAAALAALLEEMRHDPVPADADPDDWYDGDFVGGSDSPVQLNRRGDGSMQVTVDTPGDEFEFEIDEDQVEDIVRELQRLLATPVTKSLTKAAADPGTAAVAQMRENYPPKALGWMKSAQWSGPVDVPLDDIDFDDIDRWAASHDKARVKHFAKQYRKGKAVKPIVAVQEPGGDKVKIIDGHHRTLAARKLGQPVHAYVGTVDADGGPWDETHVWQFHEGADPANKSAVTKAAKSTTMAAGLAVRAADTGRVLMLQRALPTKDDGDPAED